MSMRLSEHELISPIDLLGGAAGEPFLQDIGGTNGATGWEDMKNYARGRAYVELGTWNATDDLDESKVQSSDDISGSNTAEITSDASGGNYDTDSPIDADGDFIITEFRSEHLDVEPESADAAQRYVRYYVAEGGNTGTDNACGFLSLYGYAYPHKELQGAASAGSQVYVDPNS